jgi:hypothetical protein
MDVIDRRELLKELIEKTRKEAFSSDYWDNVTDADVLGVLISQHFKWDGQAIFETMSNAFEDANFHSFNKIMAQQWGLTT